MNQNRFHGPLSKLYEGPMNDIRHKLVEEGPTVPMIVRQFPPERLPLRV